MRNTIRRLLVILAAMTSTASPLMADRQRVAILRLDGVDVSDLELTLVSHLLRSHIVNTNRFTVLERENIDRILREQSMQNIGVVSDGDAVKVGKILNVHKIVIGTLMRHPAGYFLEARLIDVETSCIDNSTTAQCGTSDSLPDVARTVAAGISRAPRSENPAPVSSLTSPPVQVASVGTMTAPDAAGQTPGDARDRWRLLGLSSYDYQRYTRSGLGVDAWTERERRSPLAAGLIGLVPCASGLLYANSIGGGMFVTMVEVLAAVGLGRSLWEGGNQATAVWGYGSLLAAVNLTDVVMSTVAATRYNARLRRLSEDTFALGISMDSRTTSAHLTVNY